MKVAEIKPIWRAVKVSNKNAKLADDCAIQLFSNHPEQLNQKQM